MKKFFNLKKYLAKKERINKLAKMPFKDGSCTLDICEFCNQTCSFCDRRLHFLKNKRKARAWNIDEFNKTLPRLAQEYQIAFSGGLGEPLLNKDLPKMLRGLKRVNKKIKLRVLTNGLTLTPKLCEEILCDVDVFRISLIAATEKTHQKFIEKSDFQKIISNLEYLKRVKPESLRLVISFIGMKDNVDEFPALVRLAHALNVDEIALQSLSERGLDLIKGQSLVRYPDLLLQKWEEAKIIANSYDNISLSITDAYKSIILKKDAKVEKIDLDNFQSTKDRNNRPRKGQTRDCLAPFYSTMIDIKGRILPCCSRTIGPKENFGNLFDNESLPAKQTKYFVKLRKALLTGKLPNYCSYCSRAPIINIEDFQKKVENLFKTKNEQKI